VRYLASRGTIQDQVAKEETFRPNPPTAAGEPVCLCEGAKRGKNTGQKRLAATLGVVPIEGQVMQSPTASHN